MERSLRRVLCCIYKRKFIVQESKRGSLLKDIFEACNDLFLKITVMLRLL